MADTIYPPAAAFAASAHADKATYEAMYAASIADPDAFWDAQGKRLGYWEGLGAQYPLAAQQPNLIDVQHRLIFVQSLEAVRALETGVLMDIREGDVGAILGWGFAPWSGGLHDELGVRGGGRVRGHAAPLHVQLCGAAVTTPKAPVTVTGTSGTLVDRACSCVPSVYSTLYTKKLYKGRLLFSSVEQVEVIVPNLKFGP